MEICGIGIKRRILWQVTYKMCKMGDLAMNGDGLLINPSQKATKVANREIITNNKRGKLSQARHMNTSCSSAPDISS